MDAAQWPYAEVAYQAVGCALCHTHGDDPLMYTLPPLDYPGLRDSRVELRLHDRCHALLVNIIGAAIFTGIREG